MGGSAARGRAGSARRVASPRCRCPPNDLDPGGSGGRVTWSQRLSARGGHAQQPMLNRPGVVFRNKANVTVCWRTSQKRRVHSRCVDGRNQAGEANPFGGSLGDGLPAHDGAKDRKAAGHAWHGESHSRWHYHPRSSVLAHEGAMRAERPFRVCARCRPGRLPACCAMPPDHRRRAVPAPHATCAVPSARG